MKLCFSFLLCFTFFLECCRAQDPPPDPPSGLPGERWNLVNTSDGVLPTKRSQSLMVYNPDDNSLLLFGGVLVSDDTVVNDMWKFDIAASTWTQVKPAGDLPSARFSMVGGLDVENKQLLVFGGEDANDNILSDLWSYNVTSNTWTELNPSGPIPERRYGAAGGVVSINGSPVFLIAYGFDAKDRWDDSFVYDVSTNTFSEIKINGGRPSARCLLAGAVMVSPQDPSRALLSMFGGCGSGGYGPCPSSQGWVLETTGFGTNDFQGTWHQTPTCVHARNYGAMVADPDTGYFFMFGGSGGPLVATDRVGQLNSMDANNLTSISWTPQVFGGENQPNQPGSNLQSSMAIDNLQNLYLYVGGIGVLHSIPVGNVTRLADDSGEILGCSKDPIPFYRDLHGVLMGLSWGFLIPIAVIIARFGRIKDPLWFKIHRALNALGIVIALVGFVIGLLMVATGKFTTIHAFFGIAVTFFGLLQPINAFFRPHKGEKNRPCWEIIHKYSGRLCLVLGLVNCFLGLNFLVGTSHAGFIMYSVWVAIYVAVFTFLTMKGLPYKANGPSKLAQAINSALVCIEPWDDSFKARDSETQSLTSNNDQDVETEDSTLKPVAQNVSEA